VKGRQRNLGHGGGQREAGRCTAAVDQEEGDDWDWAAWAAKSSGLGEK
jgi:hypothetical protein